MTICCTTRLCTPHCPPGRKLRQESPAEMREAATGQNRSRRRPVGRIRLKSGKPRQPPIAPPIDELGPSHDASGTLLFEPAREADEHST